MSDVVYNCSNPFFNKCGFYVNLSVKPKNVLISHYDFLWLYFAKRETLFQEDKRL